MGTMRDMDDTSEGAKYRRSQRAMLPERVETHLNLRRDAVHGAWSIRHVHAGRKTMNLEPEQEEKLRKAMALLDEVLDTCDHFNRSLYWLCVNQIEDT